jgi:predicted PurR-regulated permease PerM
VFSVVTVFLLAYYWLAERSTIKRAVLRLVPPARAGRVNATWLAVEAKLGGWVRGQLLVMLALGVMAGIAYTVLGLPNPVLLGVLAGVAEMIPLVGPFLAFLPALLVAVAVDPTKVLFLVPIAIVIQQIEGNLLIPRIMSHAVGVSPLTVILGILIGSIVYGPLGAFLAVPIAAAVQVILEEIVPTLQPHTGPDRDLPRASA